MSQSGIGNTRRGLRHVGCHAGRGEFTTRGPRESARPFELNPRNTRCSGLTTPCCMRAIAEAGCSPRLTLVGVNGLKRKSREVRSRSQSVAIGPYSSRSVFDAAGASPVSRLSDSYPDRVPYFARRAETRRIRPTQDGVGGQRRPRRVAACVR